MSTRKPVRLREDQLLMIAAMYGAGARHKDVARRLGIHDTRWKLTIETDPRAADAMEAGRSELHEELMGLLLSKAKAGNVPCLLFSLKVLFGYRENNPLPVEIDARVKIELPGALTPEVYEAEVREVEGAKLAIAAEAEV